MLTSLKIMTVSAMPDLLSAYAANISSIDGIHGQQAQNLKRKRGYITMTINTYFYASGLLNKRVFTEENVRVNTIEELKSYMKTLFSAMKKKQGFNDVSFQLCSDSGFFVVVDRYDSDSESFRTVFHERFNSSDNPVMKSQKNVLAWAIDIFKTDNGNSLSA